MYCDFVLRHTTTDSLVEPYSVILSHSVYWQNRDLAMFMLRFFTRRSEE